MFCWQVAFFCGGGWTWVVEGGEDAEEGIVECQCSVFLRPPITKLLTSKKVKVDGNLEEPLSPPKFATEVPSTFAAVFEEGPR